MFTKPMKNKILILTPFVLFFTLITGFSPKEYYNQTVENYVKEYKKHQTANMYQYTKTVNNETKLFSQKNTIEWEKELTYLMEYNALSPQQSDNFDFAVETHENRIKITAVRKKDHNHKTPLVSQSLLWDKTTNKPIFIRTRIIRKTWFYEQDIETKATFETENRQFYLKRIFQHFYTQIGFFNPREVLIYGKFTTQ
jgi:hypothetical protein